MVKGRIGAALALSGAMVLSGCETMTPEQRTANARAGCAVGGAAAGAIANNNDVGLLGSILIGVATAATCDYFAQQWVGVLNERDRQALEAASQQALVTGEAVEYANAETGVRATAEVVETRQYTATTTEMKVLKDRVVTTPPIDLVNTAYRIRSNANLRGGPGTDYKVVGSLPGGSVRHVIGQVQGQNWFLVAEDGTAGSGYVFGSLIEPTTQQAQATSVGGVTSEVSVATTLSCKTIKQTVFLEGTPDATEKNVEVCQQADGTWQLA